MLVHNIGRMDWHNIDAKLIDWSVDFDMLVKQKLR